MTRETARPRVLVGVVVLVAGLGVYALLVMRLAGAILSENPVVELVFYAVAGTLWLFPAIRLTRWMQASQDDDASADRPGSTGR